jgi:lipopolysaccharide/colanic/teichoic acid biosynthesis glycosyltransferase
MKRSLFVKGSFKELNQFEKVHRAPDGAHLAIPVRRDPTALRGSGIPLKEPKTYGSPYRKHGKRALDIAFVMLTLPMTLPVTLICAVALWVEGGQPFYRQERLGENGKTFSILKLRTMGTNAEQDLKDLLAQNEALRQEWETTQKLKNDPRITRVGAFLRSTSLDELPQFLNVLKGEMSVVGPRPMMPDQLPLYPDPSTYFALRPGITGAWQVSDRNENSFAHRATIDTGYDSSLSLLEDLKIIAKTVGVVLRRTGY